MTSLDRLQDEYAFLEPDDRYRLLIDLGRDARADARGAEDRRDAGAWLFGVGLGLSHRPRRRPLHFLADSNAAITKGIIALVLLTVQDRAPAEILATDIEAALAPFDLKQPAEFEPDAGHSEHDRADPRDRGALRLAPVERQRRFAEREAVEVAGDRAFQALELPFDAGIDADVERVGRRIERDQRIARPVGAACILGKGRRCRDRR